MYVISIEDEQKDSTDSFYRDWGRRNPSVAWSTDYAWKNWNKWMRKKWNQEGLLSKFQVEYIILWCLRQEE